jgi:hypothetical protein
MADETPLPEQPSPEPEKPKGDHLFKKGQSGNPLGRPAGAKTTRTKRLSLFGQIWGRAEAPADWFTDSLKTMEKSGMTVDELIAMRVRWCLASNQRFQNAGLYKEVTDRSEGKIPLRVLHKDGDDAEDDLEELSPEELRAYVQGMERRAALAAAKAEEKPADSPPPALTEGPDVENS